MLDADDSGAATVLLVKPCQAHITLLAPTIILQLILGVKMTWYTPLEHRSVLAVGSL
jgi:hypothetical protein